MANQRLAQLRKRIAEEKLDALVITIPENQYYLSGFFPGHAYLDVTMIVSAEHAWISTDSRYYEDVKQRAPDFTLFQAGYDRTKWLGEFGAQTKAKLVGFEANHLTVASLKAWSKEARKAGFKLKPTNGIAQSLRVIKTPDELATIKRAVDITDAAFAHLLTQVKPGMTEKNAAWIIEKYMRENGADAMAFGIVASGPNAALPHAIPTDRKIQKGEPIIVDIGARVDYYHSDLTRTIVLGTPDEKFNTVYETVLKAQRAAERKIREGVKCKRADAFARNVIKKAGYGDYFGHGLGHDVGLAVHDGGVRASYTCAPKETLRANMTLTIEPGIYLPGWGGVRIEDLVVIQEDGIDVLSQATKEPVVKA
ncbi:MAG: aminopeptidase P family protein [Chloroflexi bacterium]|nr:aminopeptidase P family protein [Chloroflexota bacterium]